MKKYFTILLALSALLLVGCENNTETTEEVDWTVPEETEAEKEITVVANEYSFTPSTINVDEGETVKVTLKNEGKMPHDFVVKGEGVIMAKTTLVQPGKEATVTFEATEEGEYKFICTVSGHEAQGMKGTFIVE